MSSHALPVVGQVAAADDLEAAMLGAAGVEAVQDAGGAGRGEVRRARDHVVDPFAAGAVGGEVLAEGVEVVAPGIDQAADEDLELARLRDGTARSRPRRVGADAYGVSTWRVNIDGLIEVEAAILAPAEGVNDVVCVFGAEAGEHDAALVGLAVAVGVGEVEQFGAVGDVRAAVAWLDRRWG